MNDKRPRTGTPPDRRPGRPASGRPAPKGPPRQRTESLNSEELLEMADDLEVYAREILAQARRLQRIARGGGSRSAEPPRPRSSAGEGERGRRSTESPRPRSGGEGERGERGGREAGARDSGERSRSRTRPEGKKPEGKTGGRPAWAPEHRKRKS